MKMDFIRSKIYSDFAATYKNATHFIDSGELWELSMDVLMNPTKLSNIVFANNLGVPPVKSLLYIYKMKKSPEKDFEFTGQESQ